MNPRSPAAIDRLVGANIRRERIKRGLTQEALATAVGVTFQQMQKYETGRNRLTVGRLLDIGRALDIRPEKLWQA